MRPVLPTNHPLNTRSSDRPDSLVRPSSTVPTACFITTEADLDARRDRSRPRLRQQSDQRKCSRNSRRPSTPRQRRSPPRTGRKPAYPASESDDSEDSSVESVVEKDSLNLPSQPSTPSLIGLSHSGSVMSISSQSYSLAGPSVDAHSDLIHDDVSLPVTDQADNQENQSTVPQLIMPSLMVPRRRPFSEVGKSLGKLKIMVAGQCGIGKTSLIKTLAERCKHIVHMDPIENHSAVHATETYASSRPQPWWRSDSELAVTARRRISTTGDVLDRNVCFVESPGRRPGASGSWRDLHYVESHLASLMNKPMADSDLFTLVNSGGEPVVDALLYLIPHSGLVREDVEYIKRAQRMTNVIPVLTRVDELAPEEIKHIKQQVVKSLVDKDVDYFSFAGPDDSEETKRTPSWDRLELYNWANNLRQSLQSERLYHLMEERAISNAVAKQSSLVYVPGNGNGNGKKKTQSKKRKAPQPTHQDPLGLLEMGGGLKQKGMLALEMVSSVGLVGLVASKIMHTGWSDGICSVVASRRRNIEVGRLSMVLSF
ncbi:hypothetical protein FPRO03_04083 [Fusarium proliferatum]|nr:hypothetical protein FPRO03_04083 [Fusarium proliferatum]